MSAQNRWGAARRISLVFLAAVATFTLLEVILFVGSYEGAGGQDNDFGAAAAMAFCLAASPYFLIAAVAAGWFTHSRMTSRLDFK